MQQAQRGKHARTDGAKSNVTAGTQARHMSQGAHMASKQAKTGASSIQAGSANAVQSTTSTPSAQPYTVSQKELKHLKRSELVELVQVLSEGAEADDSVRAAAANEQLRLAKQSRFKRALYRTLGVFVVVAAVAVLVSTLLFPVLEVSGNSMEPTLHEGEVLVLLKSGDFETGDLVSFNWQNRLLIKRVIAGPGDIISIDSDGVVTVNDQVLDEPYVDELSLGTCDMTFPYQVPDGRYFVMGDHRSVSIDSRSSEIGCVESKQIVGKVLVRIWPISDLTLLG